MRSELLPTIRPVTSPAVEKAIATLVLAFAGDPVVRWMYPDPAIYLDRFPGLIRAFGGAAFGHGTARIISDASGAALWLPPPLHPDGDELGAVLDSDLPAALRDDANALFGEMAAFHPSEPHWYLPLIGVDPVAQGRGLGSSLLNEALQRCDEDQIAVYLETTNPKNITLYQRHGFDSLGTIRAGSAPPIVPMLRQARSKNSRTRLA